MFRKRAKPAAPAPSSGAAELEQLVRSHLAQANDETVQIVTAIAGLLAAVAYADRDFSAAEEQRAEQHLGTIQGLSPDGCLAICAALRSHALELGSIQVPRYTRALRELGNRELRVQVLALLVDLAAADENLSFDEVKQLRLIAQALGLTQDDYNALQARHRDRLSSLR